MKISYIPSLCLKVISIPYPITQKEVMDMDILVQRGCGLDVHKETVVA